MKIAIYGKSFNEDFDESIRLLFTKLSKQKVETYFYTKFADYLQNEKGIHLNSSGIFDSYLSLGMDMDCMLSIGGDGTFLETVSIVGDKSIPIIGFNTGRLGFLSNIAREEIIESIDAIIQKRTSIEERTLLEVDSGGLLFRNFKYAFNEITIQKTRTSMISIHAWVNGEYLNSYWADGLIVCTPSGSTAYSLSVGGPIMSPDSGTFIISPIAPHNLAVRPIILPDNCEITLKAESRENILQASADYLSEVYSGKLELKLRKAPFTVKILRLDSNSFFSTLRNKLLWGADKRN
jgi:NAD+ kinase